MEEDNLLINHRIVSHPDLSELSRSSTLLQAVNLLNENPSEEETALRVATILANSITVPPVIEVSLFWKCISVGLTASDTLDGAEKYKTELDCLHNKLAQVLAEAIFMRPEEVSLKRCIEEVGSRAATLAGSRKFCHDLLIRLVSSVCVVAKFERKTASESFNRSVVALTKSIINLNFPIPIEESLGKIISNSLSLSFDEFSSLLPLILMTAINETTLNSKLVVGVFVPVIRFLSTLSLTLEKREAIDTLCWQILKKIITKPDEIIGDPRCRDIFIQAVTEFLASQRAGAIEPHLPYLLPFGIANQYEQTILAMFKSFQNAGRADVLLKNSLEQTTEESKTWLIPLVGAWLRKNFSLTTPSFPSIWKFLLAECVTSENSLRRCTALWCFHNFLSGLQAFGNQETVLPTVRSEFRSLCLETVDLLSSSEFKSVALSETEFAIPALNCLSSTTVILALGEMETEDLKVGTKTVRKVLKKCLKKCIGFANDRISKEHVLNALVTLCLIEDEKGEHIEQLESFLANKKSKTAFNISSAINFYLRHRSSNQNAQIDSTFLCTLIDIWLAGAPETECAGQQLILALRLLDERQCLDSYFSSGDMTSQKRGAIINLLSYPKSLVLLSSLPHKVRVQLLELTLANLDKADSKHNNCSINLIGHVLKRESDFGEFGIFEKFSVVTFMEILEHHVECDCQVVAKLARLACNSLLNDDELLSKLVAKFLLKRFGSLKANLVVCQCLFSISRKIRTLHYKAPIQKLITELDEDKFLLLPNKVSLEENGCWFVLAVCLVSLLDWPKFGRDKVTSEAVHAVCKEVVHLGEFERNLWSSPLVEILSKCLNSNSNYDELNEASGVLLSDIFSNFNISSSAFVTSWQKVFTLAGKDAGKLLSHILFINSDDLEKKQNNCAKFGPLCRGYLKALVNGCENESHSEEEHENAVWLENDPGYSPCKASEMVFALYEVVTAYPLIGAHCLPVVSQYGFFNTHTRGLLSFDLLLAIAVSAARCSVILAQSHEHYTAYCSLLSSLLRLRAVQQENSDRIRLSNILHIILFCLSAAFKTLLEFSLPQNNIAIYFQDLGKLVAVASYRHRMLGDAAVHVVAAALVSAVRSPLPAGFAGLPPVFRKQLIAIVVQLFQMCSERALKSMALFLPPECLPLLKSLRSEAFVQRKARRKV